MLTTKFYAFDEEKSLPFFLKAGRISPHHVSVFLKQENTIAMGAVRIAIPPGEFKHYKKIQGLSKKFLPMYKQAWDKAKPKIAAAYIEERSTEVKKIALDFIFVGLASVYSSFRKDMNEVATNSFLDGVETGTNYFEDSFKVNGLDKNQASNLRADYLETFEIRSQNLFENQALDTLDAQNPVDEFDVTRILDSFDRFLLQYAGIAAAVAYEVFARSVEALNSSLTSEKGSIPFPGGKPFALQWVLGEVAGAHSPDCVMMSRGNFFRRGIGVWDVQDLTNTGLTPRSPSLDCGGNCHCHLHPVSLSNDTDDNGNGGGLLQSFTSPVSDGSDIFNIVPNINATTLLELFKARGWSIPKSLEDTITSNSFFRRSEFFDSFPPKGVDKAIDYGVHIRYISNDSDFWAVSGTTRVTGEGITLTPKTMTVTISVPNSITLIDGDISSLDLVPTAIQEKVQAVLAHELGHSFWFNLPDTYIDDLGRQVISTILDDAATLRMKVIINNEYDFFLSRIDDRVKKAIDSLDIGTLTPDLRLDVINLQKILNDVTYGEGGKFTNVIKEIWKAIKQNDFISVRQNGKRVDVHPASVLESLAASFRKLGIDTDMISQYQLWTVDEYWAEFIGLMATNPVKARLHNERLYQLFRQEFGEFGTEVGSTTKIVAPDQVSINQLLDVPKLTTPNPIPPNSLFDDLIPDTNVSSTVLGLTSKGAKANLKEVFDEFPTLLRSEMFDKNSKFDYINALQMKKISGSSNTIVIINPQTSVVTINSSKWDILTLEQKSRVLSDLASETIEANIKKAGLFSKVQDIWQKKIEEVLDILQIKGARQGVLNSIKNGLQILRDAIKKKGSAIWNSIFNDVSSLLKKSPDLPIRNIDSLRSPESFLREFISGYVTGSKTMSKSEEELYDILLKVLKV